MVGTGNTSRDIGVRKSGAFTRWLCTCIRRRGEGNRCRDLGTRRNMKIRRGV